jgi:hypothetical protein
MSDVVRYPALAKWLSDLIAAAGHASIHEFAQLFGEQWQTVNRWAHGYFAPKRKEREPFFKAVMAVLIPNEGEREAAILAAKARNVFVPVDRPRDDVQAAQPIDLEKLRAFVDAQQVRVMNGDSIPPSDGALLISYLKHAFREKISILVQDTSRVA